MFRSTPAPTLADILFAGETVLSETFDRRGVASSGAVLATGSVACALLPLRGGMSIGNIAVIVQTAAVGAAPPPTLFKLGFISKTGLILAVTADTSTDAQWLSTGGKTFPLLNGPFRPPASDDYYACVLQVGAFATTQPALYRGLASAGPLGGAFGTGVRLANVIAGQADLVVGGQLAFANTNDLFYFAALP